MNIEAKLCPAGEAKATVDGTEPADKAVANDEGKAQDDSSWEDTGKRLKKSSDEHIGQWNDEIDGYLTFVRILTTMASHTLRHTNYKC